MSWLIINIINLIFTVGTTPVTVAQTPRVPVWDSPYEIARVVNESSRQWDKNRVSVEVNLTPTWEHLGIEPGSFAACDGGCEANIFKHELDGQIGSEVVLKLTGSLSTCRYLVFKRISSVSSRRWKLLGHVDHDFNRYEMTRHRIVPTRGRNWLVIWGQEGSGSGFSLYFETWYEVSAQGLRPVLSYPAQGGVVPWPSGVAREFKAHVVSPRSAAKNVALSYSVTYTPYFSEDDVKTVYRNRHTVLYAWDDRRQEFVFDARRSNISEEEIAAIADIQVEPGEGTRIGGSEFFSEGDAWKRGGYEVFLKYNLHRLLKVARSKNIRQKEWLPQFLQDCADTPEKKILERALRK